MDNLPISIALLNKLRYLLNIPLCSEEQGAQNQNNGDDENKIEGKYSKSFSTLLEIARKDQLFIENTVTK